MSPQAAPTERELEEMERHYNQGLGLLEVGQMLGFSMTTVAKYLRKRGVKLRGRGRPVTREGR